VHGASKIVLPKGGGAIRGIGEKFAAKSGHRDWRNVGPNRHQCWPLGFVPQMSLAYDSGTGNGPFGFGWNLALLSITRKTSKRLAQYLDRAESVVIILTGAEGLVPVLSQN
jgi:hypothetical protein